MPRITGGLGGALFSQYALRTQSCRFVGNAAQFGAAQYVLFDEETNNPFDTVGDSIR